MGKKIKVISLDRDTGKLVSKEDRKKIKFLHFKTVAGYNAERNKTQPDSNERKIFDSYISFIDEGPMICTWGKQYKCNIDYEEVVRLIEEAKVHPGDIIPLVASGEGEVGTSVKYSREDHVHPEQIDIKGNAGTATKLANPRTIELTGDVTGSTSFDGSADISITATVLDNSHTHDNSTITSLDASKITSGTIDIDRLPKGAMERLVVVENEEARFNLTKDKIQEGDTVKQEDTGVMYYVVDSSNLDNENGYKEYTAASATKVPWSGVTDKPSTFPPILGTTADTAYPGDKGKGHDDVISSLGTSILTDIGPVTADTEDVDVAVNKIQRESSDGATVFKTSEVSSFTIPAATTDTAGVMTANDKAKIDSMGNDINDAIETAKEYTNQKFQEAEGYTDTKVQEESTARETADNALEEKITAEETRATEEETKIRSEFADADTQIKEDFAEADKSTLETAKEYADTQDTVILQESKEYTDEKITDVTSKYEAADSKIREDFAAADSALKSELQNNIDKKLNIGAKEDTSDVQSYYGLKKYAEEKDAETLNAAKEYITGEIGKIPEPIVYKADGTTITQFGENPVTFSIGTIPEDKVSGLTGKLDTKADSSVTITAGTGLTGGGDLTESRTLSHQEKPTEGTDAGGTGSFVTGVTIDDLGHVVSTTKGNAPTLSGGSEAEDGKYVSGVIVSGHAVTVTKESLPAIPAAGTVEPKAPGDAVVGTSAKWAHEDHVHPEQIDIKGNAGTATKLSSARNIAITGAVSGNADFDGSANISINTTLANIDASKITSGTLNANILPEIPISKIPAAAMERLYIVESQSAAMSLPIQEGDVVQIGSGGPMYFCVSESASTFATKFKVFTAGAATSVPWSGVTNAPTKLSQFTNDSGFTTNKGTVTSVAMSVPTGLSISGSPITASGTLALSYTSGYSIPTTAKQTNWDTAYGWGNHASAGYVKNSVNENITGIKNFMNGFKVFKNSATTSNEYNTTGKINFTDYAAPIIFGTNSGKIWWSTQFQSSTILLIGRDKSIPIRIQSLNSSEGNASEIYATRFYQNEKLVATEEWVTNKGYLTSVPAQTWASITGKPTTLAGYGITDAIKNTVAVSASTLDAGSSATASYDASTNKFTFGIPRGATGAQGATGPKGDTGATGPTGPTGPAGAAGKSAYEIWKAQSGNSGKSEAEFLASLKGARGATGAQGATGPAGPAGPTGPKGDTGSQGPKGDKGDTGPAGTYTAGTNISISSNKISCTYSYTLPTASSTTLGGVKIGDYITLSSGTISVTSSNIEAALGYKPVKPTDMPATLPNPKALTINGTSYTGSSAVSVTTSKPLTSGGNTSGTVVAGRNYNATSSSISSVSGFSYDNPDAVVGSNTKITSFPSSVRKMDGIADLSGSYYVYCFSYIGGYVYVNGAVYA